MTGLFNWSTTASSNSTVGSINFAEGQNPSTVNDSARALMADVAAFRDLIGGAKTTSGTDTVTLTSGCSITAYAAGLFFIFKAGGTNTGAATLNVDSLGTKALELNGSALAAGDITSGKYYLAVYDGTAFQITRLSQTFGTAAALNVGTSANNLVQLNGSAELPAVSGANLTNLPGVGANLIINGDMRIAQRGTSFSGGTANADDKYTLDRWYNLAEGADSVDITQSSTSPDTNGYSYAMDVETTGEKFGLAQIIEAANCIGAIGNTVTLSFDAKVSNARIDTVKAAIIAWSGTADSVTSDIISSWNADGMTPTLIANATFENTPADLGVTTSWARYSVSAAVDTASAANIIVFIWSDDATNPIATDFLYVSNVKLEVGTSASDFIHDDEKAALDKCKRYYNVLGNISNMRFASGYNYSTTEARALLSFPEMRTAPTSTITTATNFRVLHTGGATAATAANTSLGIGKHNALLVVTVASGLTAGQGCVVDNGGTSEPIKLDAEL